MRPRAQRSSSDPSLPPGLRLGDGVFETFRTHGGVPFLLPAHARRLVRGGKALGLRGTPSSVWVEREVGRALHQKGTPGRGQEWIIRPLLYAHDGACRFELQLDPVPASGTRVGPINVGTSEYPHPGRFLRPPFGKTPVKWLARGPLAHALRRARAKGWEEALLCDASGRLVEGSRSNLLVYTGRRLIAPGPRSDALPGITREIVLRWARAWGVPTVDRPVLRREMLGAREAFLTSSLLGVAPIARFDGHPVGTGPLPGPLTRRLQEKYARAVESAG